MSGMSWCAVLRNINTILLSDWLQSVLVINQSFLQISGIIDTPSNHRLQHCNVGIIYHRRVVKVFHCFCSNEA